MSRETDSSFPKGSEPDEPQTETTLTTRIKINIPGSRPIPPVVVRKPVDPSESTSPAERGEGEQEQTRAGQAPSGATPSTASSTDDSTSSWFAPRKPPTATPAEGTPQAFARTETPVDGTPAVGNAGAYHDSSSGRGGAAESLSAFDGGAHQPVGHATPRPGEPTGPTTGPASGDMQLLPPGFQQPPGARSEPTPSSDPQSSSGITGIMKPPVATGGAGRRERDPHSPDGGAVDDPFAGFPGVASGPLGPGSDSRPTPEDPGGREDRETADPEPESAPAPPKRKGRSTLVLLGVAVAGALGIAYGAGLLLNHSDVPNGTTVLGVNIGGSTQEEAVSKLEAALGDRTTAPLKISVSGEEQTLKPSVAGLSLDTEATVRSVSGRDYNPISVIGGLLGQSREVQPTYQVDEEKLAAAVQSLGGGNAAEGMVRFVNGEAVPVPGKASMAVDPAKASSAIEKAYKERAASGEDVPVKLPVSKQEPKITGQEIQRAIKQYGEPAMSGWVWLKAGNVEVPFSEKSIGDFYTLRAGGDTLQPVIDSKVLAEKYGGAFDGVVIDAGTGTVEMTPAHATAAITKALMEKAPPEPGKRVAEVENARSAG